MMSGCKGISISPEKLRITIIEININKTQKDTEDADNRRTRHSREDSDN